MQYLIGFIIALFIALTGVGAGTVTVPVLVLFLGVPAPVAVGIGLMFATAVKLILVPAQIMRRNVAWRTLGFMLMGGVPGVIIGSLFLKHLVNAGSQNLMNALLGMILVTTAAYQIVVSFRPLRQNANARDRSSLLSWLMFPVGAEVGFSSAGAGALGSRGAAQPDAAAARASGRHGYRLRLFRFADRQRRALVLARLESGVADSPHHGRRRRIHCWNAGQHTRPAPASCALRCGCGC